MSWFDYGKQKAFNIFLLLFQSMRVEYQISISLDYIMLECVALKIAVRVADLSFKTNH